MDDMEIVSAVLAALAERVGRERFELWFGPQTRLTVRAASVLVEAPNRFYQDWLRNQFRRDLEAVCAQVLRRQVTLEFRIEPSLQKGDISPTHTQNITSTSNGTYHSQNAELAPIVQFARAGDVAQADCLASTGCAGTDGRIVDHTSELPGVVDAPRTRLASPPEGGAAPTRDPRPGQTPANQGRTSVQGRLTTTTPPATTGRPRQYARMDQFVSGSGNRLAHAAALQVLDSPGETNPLLIYGGTGTGKTHLLEAILTSNREAPRPRNAVYLTAEQFTTQFLEALHGGGLPMFRRKIRGVDLLLLDDVQFLFGKRATLTELLHTVDALLVDQRQIVLTADRPIQEMQELGRELGTRLSGGLVARLDPPDHATRIGILRQFSLKLGVELDAEVIDFVATQFSSHARELAGAVHRLRAVSRMTGQPITVAQADDSLAELLHRQTRGVKLQDIERAVCEVLGLPAESLQTERRVKSLNTTRMLAMWLARKHTRVALTEIGSYFGRRSHSTVISAQKAVGGWVNQQEAISFGQQTWNIEEAIRRVEEKLRSAG
ncbi:MAG: chromosomal replication initiator protein DnaA [Pirellulales bacterium]|nr:chromosomal replication initiator protein DnaA [Pirellulales bacterium]